MPIVTKPHLHDALIASLLTAVTFGTGALLLSRFPHFYYEESFLYFDQGVNLYLADQILSGKNFYQHSRYPYGPMPIYSYTLTASLFGNSCYIYMGFQQVIASLNAGLLFLVLRKIGVHRTQAAIVSAIVIPYIVTPGAVLGDFTTAAYIQMERLYLTLLPLVLLSVMNRSRSSAVQVGFYLAGYQYLKFGGCYFAGSSLVFLDLFLIYSIKTESGDLMKSFRFWLRAAAFFLAAEAMRAAIAFAFLPTSAAWDVIWPAYAGRAYSHIPIDFPSSRELVQTFTKWIVPPTGVVIAVRTLYRRANIMSLSLCVYGLFYAVGSLKYFGHTQIFFQYAWMLVASVASLPPGRKNTEFLVGLLVLSWLIFAAPFLTRPPTSEANPRSMMPNGDVLYTSQDEISNAISKALNARFGQSNPPGRILILPIGAGHHFYHRTQPFSADLWLIPAYVDHGNETQLLQAVSETSVIIGPADDPLDGAERVFPPSVLAALQARAEPPILITPNVAVRFLKTR
jgi:uncharacterized membrane protein